MAGLFDKILKRGKYTCPYCFTEYDKSEILYICPDCRKATIPTDKEKNAVSIPCRNIRDSEETEEIENLGNFESKPCGGKATIRLCPYCQDAREDGKIPKGSIASIPPLAIDVDGSLPLCIIGLSESGKTNFITVMINELKHIQNPRLGISVLDKHTRDEYKRNYDRIYEEHIVPDATIEVAEAEQLKPLLWQVKNLARKKRMNTPTYNFIIYDGAGEQQRADLDVDSPIFRYIQASNAVIITLDPLRLSSLKKLISQDVRMASSGNMTDSYSMEDIINRVALYIKSAHGIKSNQILKMPIAVVLTKFDTILQLDSLAKDALIRKPSMVLSNGKVNMTEIEQIDEEIRAWLCDIGEEQFITMLESHFKNFNFFGVSSYGEVPKEGGTTSENIRPHRVLDPVLWLLKEEHFID